jgi:hypothetical protein
LQFNGSGNQIARQLVQQERPKIATMSLPAIAQLSAGLIRRTHDVMNAQGPAMVTVGPNALVAIIDDKGAQMVEGSES